jgi:predicted HAD superfamily Cof-like phosphohydrolase
MERIDSLNLVAEFHRLFKAPILDSPQIPEEARARLRYNLLNEELTEFWEAVQAHDLVGVADALCDLQYVLSGAILEFGLGEKFVALFNEVQRSNMSKACQSREEAEATVRFYLEKDGTESFFEEHDGLFIVYRKSDHKTLKSIAYSTADLSSILSN